MKALPSSLLFVALSFLGAEPVLAQTRYTCRDEGGAVYTLSRPCPKGMVTTAVSAGPVEQRSYRQESSTPQRSRVMRDEPDYMDYMSGRCRTLRTSIRAASANGSKYEVIAGMQREYRRDCSDEETEASSRYYKEQRESRRQRRDDERQQQEALQAGQEQDARRAQQCAESRRILAAKKARTDLTPGERNDLRRFEDNITARCAKS